jgi:O-antigen/teichoic acid export membrane protein
MFVLYSALQLVGVIIPSALGFFLAALLTRHLSPDQYGAFGLTSAVSQMVAQSYFGWIGLSIIRLAPKAPDVAFRGSVFVIFSALSAIAVVAAASSHVLAPNHSGGAIWLVGIAGAIAFGYNDIKGSFFAAHVDFRRSFMLKLARALASFALAILAVLQGFGGMAVFLCSSIGAVIAALLFPLRSRSGQRYSFDAAQIWSILRFGLPLAASFLLLATAAWADRLVIQEFSGASAVGLYAATAVLIQMPLSTFGNAIGSVALPLALRAYDTAGNAEANAQLQQNLLLLVGCLMPVGLGVVLVAGNIAHVLAGPAYRATLSELAPVLSLTAVITGIRVNYIEHAFHMSRRTRPLLSLAVVAAIVNILSLFALVPLFGYEGAALAALLTALATALCAAVAAYRFFPLPVPLWELAKIGVALVAMAGVLQPMLSLRGPLSLALEILGAATAYGTVLLALNIANLRGLLLATLSGGLGQWSRQWRQID